MKKLKLEQRILPKAAESRRESELPESLCSFAQLKLPLISVQASTQTHIFPLLPPVTLSVYTLSWISTPPLKQVTPWEPLQQEKAARVEEFRGKFEDCVGEGGQSASQRHGEEMEDGKKQGRAFTSLLTVGVALCLGISPLRHS